MAIQKEFGPRRAGAKTKTILLVPVSFETGEQAAAKVYFPYAVRITKIRGIVTKAIAATDAATVTGANSSGASTGGVVTFPLSSAINVEPTAAAPSTNNTVAADSYYLLTAAKTTAGGKALVTLEFNRE